MSKNITQIGKGAFKGCKLLNKVEFSNGLVSIGISAFEGCNNLEEIILPNTVELIDEQAFSKCKKLLRIIIPNSIKTINGSRYYRNIFYGCDNLKEIIYMGTKEDWKNIKKKYTGLTLGMITFN